MGWSTWGTFQGGQFAQALGVNSDGSVIVGFGDMADSNIHAFRWTVEQGFVDLGVLAEGGGLAECRPSLGRERCRRADGQIVGSWDIPGLPLD